MEAWHARSLTNVSWQLPTGSASAQDRVIIFWDTLATGLLRFGNIMNETSISVTSSLTTLHTVFPEEMGAGSDICNYTAYETDQRNAFHSESLSGESTVDLEDSLAWWYTSSLAQEVDGAETSDQGESLVLLSDPGVYFVCLLLGNDSCEATECLELMVYQPPYDFMEVRRPYHVVLGKTSTIMHEVRELSTDRDSGAVVLHSILRTGGSALLS